jgi:hypothetical protein
VYHRVLHFVFVVIFEYRHGLCSSRESGES